MALTIVLSLVSVTDTTAEVVATDSTSTGPVVEGATVTLNTGATADTDENGIATFTSLTASTSYTATAGIAGTVTFTTKATGYDTPMAATQEQWEDLAAKVKAKADASTTPTITMTNTDPGEGAVLAADNYIAVYGGDPIIMDYSTTEIKTGVKWIDGSAIYKKTIDFGALPNATTKSVAHNISNLSAVIKIEGVCSAGDSWTTVPLMFNSASATFNTDFYVDGTYLNASSGQNVSNRNAYITLYYTKSS